MLVELLILLIIVGAVLYVISIVPLDGTIKQIIYVITIVVVLIYLIRNFMPNL